MRSAARGEGEFGPLSPPPFKDQGGLSATALRGGQWLSE